MAKHFSSADGFVEPNASSHNLACTYVMLCKCNMLFAVRFSGFE